MTTPISGAAAGDEGDRASELGAIFTKRWVAELVLDLTGYTAAEPLYSSTVLEPSCGHGAFLSVVVERLIQSCERDSVDLAGTGAAILAFDLDPTAVDAARTMAVDLLKSHGVDNRTAKRLAGRWVRQGDFLKVAKGLRPVRWLVGNPPYVRLEDVSKKDMATYRSTWKAMSGRADVYVGFFEAGLSLLQPGGKLGYICADRWMRNRYGAGLRHMVEQQFAMETCLVMHAVDAFEDRVSAYPAVTVIASSTQAEALVVDADERFDAAGAARLVKAQTRGPAPVVVDSTFRASWLPAWPRDVASWPSGPPERLALLTELESRLPTLTEAGVLVSVGVATGADDVYVVRDAGLVEEGRALRTLAARETASGGISWKERYLLNPWDVDGLIDLDVYPKFAAHMRANEARLRERYVARANPDRWWRTIDRIDPAAPSTPKLLIPDLKDRIFPVYDSGQYMPLHSLYYMTSDRWDLAVLGGLLMSDIANMFVESYSVKMANGYMRVSAQYLRLVRVPEPESLSKTLKKSLERAFWNRDAGSASQLARSAYGLR